MEGERFWGRRFGNARHARSLPAARARAGAFRHVLTKLWLLWELALLGEPTMVVAPTPSDSSGAVAALLSLVAPLPCALDFRPYFTIHDPIFASLAATPPGARATRRGGVAPAARIRGLCY